MIQNRNMTRLRIAVQKSGRLKDESLNLLRKCGLKIQNGSNQLKSNAENFSAEILFLRDDDIPEYVQDGIADIGIIGENVWLEKEKKTEIIESLGFSKCRMSIAVPRTSSIKSVQELDQKRIATSYPVILRRFLNDNDINAEIHVISGSVEIAPGIGLADAIFDIVSTGSTLLSNGLVEIHTVIRSEAVLVGNKSLSADKKQILDSFLFRLEAVQNAQSNKYILLNAPNDAVDAISKIIPGMDSPTVLPLKKEGWSSVHSVVKEGDFWSEIDKLKEAGAKGILVIPIEKMIL